MFALTLFVSAVLLFVVEPLTAKELLPLLGGSAAVWTTCMLFFQGALLAGYAYAHVTLKLLGPRKQTILHAALLLLGLAFLPLTFPTDAPTSAVTSPIPWLLNTLVRTLGLPFFVITTSAPLLQSWLTAAKPGRDPYPLYAASNLGSMLALLSYPTLIEPFLPLSWQARIWTVGYGVLIVMVIVCAASVWRGPAEAATVVESAPEEAISWKRKGRWVLLAFVPSSLTLGVTSYVTTDLAPIPLWWVAPLSLYLLSFILTFSRKQILSPRWMSRLLPAAAVLTTLTMFRGQIPMARFVVFDLLTLFFAAMVCHGELAGDRPSAGRLTEFFLWLSIGGALGGVFNAIVAPLIFDRLIEYPLMIVLACLLRPAPSERDFPWTKRLDAFAPYLIATAICVSIALVDVRTALAGAVAAALGASLRGRISEKTSKRLDIAIPLIALIASAAWFLGVKQGSAAGDPAVRQAFAALGVLGLILARRPVRFGLFLGAMMIVHGVLPSGDGRLLARERNFFGVLRVVDEPGGKFRQLFHGSTLHGRQALDPKRSEEPLSYFHRSGPFGEILEEFHRRKPGNNVAVVGLGVGALAGHARAGERWTFYEIDPAVIRIAGDPRYFTFLRDCRAGLPTIILGDARLRIREAADHSYGLIVIDAFSSDVVPTHLLTREAMKIYLSKLAPGGLIAFHISNRFLDLREAIQPLARDEGLSFRYRWDLGPFDADQSGKDPSLWVVTARRSEPPEAIDRDPRWGSTLEIGSRQPWTDDYSDIIRSIMYRGF